MVKLNFKNVITITKNKIDKTSKNSKNIITFLSLGIYIIMYSVLYTITIYVYK